MPDADGMYCEPIRDEDGTLLGIARVSGPLTERDQEALRDLAAAVLRRMDEEDAADPEAAERQASAIARVRRRAGLNGGVPVLGEDTSEDPR